MIGAPQVDDEGDPKRMFVTTFLKSFGGGLGVAQLVTLLGVPVALGLVGVVVVALAVGLRSELVGLHPELSLDPRPRQSDVPVSADTATGTDEVVAAD